MTTYMIDSGDGNWLRNAGDDLSRARATAQEIADERGETVTLYESPMPTDADGEGNGYAEDIDPTPPAIHLAISAGTPSDHYPADERAANGALDYDVTLTIGDTATEGGITLYPDENGKMSTCGTPLDGWCGSTILDAIKALPEQRRRAVLDALSSLDDGDVA